MIIDWNVEKVISDCQRMYFAANDNYETGWNQWPCKQDLYRVKFAVDEMLANTCKFSGEQEWLDELEKEKMWKALKK